MFLLQVLQALTFGVSGWRRLMIQGKEHGFRARMPVGLCRVCHSGSVLIRGQSLDAACKVS